MTDDTYDDAEEELEDEPEDDYGDEIAPEGNRAAGGRAKAVVEHVARHLVDDPEGVFVDANERRDTVTLLIHASPGDMGRIIGKRGRVIQALRQVGRAAGSTEGVRITVDVAEQTDRTVMRLEVGRVAKAHGLRGEVVVVPITNQPDRFLPGAQVWCNDQPMVIETSRPHQGAHLVRFAGITDRNEADRLRGASVTAEPTGPAAPGEVWVHELIGAEVRDRAGTALGRVVAVEANPAHDLLVLDRGLLIPMVFVVEQDPEVVVVDLPEGLLDL